MGGDWVWGVRALDHAPGLQLNAVRVFENACSSSVLCSVFESERVRLNVFGSPERLFGLLSLVCFFEFECDQAV